MPFSQNTNLPVKHKLYGNEKVLSLNTKIESQRTPAGRINSVQANLARLLLVQNGSGANSDTPDVGVGTTDIPTGIRYPSEEALGRPLPLKEMAVRGSHPLAWQGNLRSSTVMA